MNAAVSALVSTCLIEVPLVALVYPRERGRMATTALAVNMATNLTLNLVVLRNASAARHETALLLGELGVLIVEALLYLLVSRRHEAARAVMASGLANALSFGAGGMVAHLLVG